MSYLSRRRRSRGYQPIIPAPVQSKEVPVSFWMRALEFMGRPHAALYGGISAPFRGAHPLREIAQGLIGGEHRSVAEDLAKIHPALAIPGAAVDALIDPITYTGVGALRGGAQALTRAGREVILSQFGKQAQKQIGARALREITEQMTRQAGVLRKAGKLPQAASVERRLADPDYMNMAVQRGYKRRMADAMKADPGLVDPGGLKFAGKTIVPGQRIKEAAAKLIKPITERIPAKWKARAAAEKTRLHRLVSRRATPIEARMADEMDIARFESMIVATRAPNEVRAILAEAKKQGINAEEILQKATQAAERPQEMATRVATRQVRGVSKKRQFLERELALLRSRREARMTGQRPGRQPVKPQLAPVTTTFERSPERLAAIEKATAAEQIGAEPIVNREYVRQLREIDRLKAVLQGARPGEVGETIKKQVRGQAAKRLAVSPENPRYMALLAEIDRAKERAKGLPPTMRQDVEKRLAVIRTRMAAPRPLVEPAAKEVEGWGVGSSMEYTVRAPGPTGKTAKIGMKVVEVDEKGNVLVEVVRTPKIGKRTPLYIARYPKGSKHYVKAEQLDIPEATKAGRVLSAERKSIPQNMRKFADTLNTEYKRIAEHAYDEMNQTHGLLSLTMKDARDAGPSVYRSWLEGKGTALRDMDNLLGIDGGYISRANAVEAAEAILKGTDPTEARKAIVGLVRTGPSMVPGKVTATPVTRAMEGFRQALLKQEQKLAGRVTRLERRTEGISPFLDPSRVPGEVERALTRVGGKLTAREQAARAAVEAAEARVRGMSPFEMDPKAQALARELRQKAAGIKPFTAIEKPTTMGRLATEEAALRARLQATPGRPVTFLPEGKRSTLLPGQRPRKFIEPHPMVQEKRLVAEAAPGAVDRLNALPAGVRAWLRTSKDRLETFLRLEKKSAVPTPRLKDPMSQYWPHVVTQEAKEAIDTLRAVHPLHAGREINEEIWAKMTRELRQRDIVDHRRYLEAYGKKPVGKLTDRELFGATRKGIIFEYALPVEEVNRRAQAGELRMLGAEFDVAGKLSKKGMVVKEFFTENPVVAFAERARQHYHAMAAGRFIKEMKRQGPEGYGAIFLKKGAKPPVGHKAVSHESLKGWVFPEESAKLIDGTMQRFESPEVLTRLGRMFDQLQGTWKTWQLSTMGYNIRNASSDAVTMNFAGAPAREIPSWVSRGLRMVLGGTDEIRAPQGTVYKGQALRDLGDRLGVSGGYYGHELERSVAEELRKVPGWERIAPGRRNAYFEIMRKLGQMREDSFRWGLFMQRLSIGDDPVLAAKRVQMYLFDYGDLTLVERKIGRRLLPFYTWTRKAIPLYTRELLAQPGKFTQVGHLARGIELATGGEEPDPRFLPNMLMRDIPVRVWEGEKGKKYEYFRLGSWLPQTSINALAQPYEELLSMLTPAISAPGQWISNRSWLTGEEIERYPDQPGTVMGVPLPGAVGGVKLERLARSLSIINTLDKLVDQPHRVQKGWKAKAASILLGAHTQTVDIQKGRENYIYRMAKQQGAMKAAYDRAIAGGYTSEAKMLEPLILRLARERQEIGPPTPRQRSVARPSDLLIQMGVGR